MRVLLVNDLAAGPGSGTEVYLGRLCAGLTDAGDSVDMWAGEIAHDGIARVLDGWDPRARRELGRRVESFRPDVVHFHNILRELSISVLWGAPSVPRVITVHDRRLLGVADVADRRPRTLLKLGQAWVARKAATRQIDVAIAHSKSMAAQVADAGFARVELVPMLGPPAGEEPGRAPSDSRTVLYVGRLALEKGVLDLVTAFSLVAARHPDARLVLAGDGPAKELIERARAAMPQGAVVMTGLLSEREVAAEIRKARVVVAPSRRPESAGLSVLEAAMAGRPTIVSDDPALRELIDATGGGLVVAKESPPALAAALDRLLADGAVADQMGVDARRGSARAHCPEVVIPAIQAVYRQAALR